MKKIWRILPALLIVLAIGLASCKKSSCPTVNQEVPTPEVEQLSRYINNNQISAQKDQRGFYYIIQNEGSSKRPTACSNVTVSYQGKLTNGHIFDQSDNISFDLSGLIAGWQEGLPLIGEEGKITLYLPPSLGYGNQGVGSVPPNSITIFTITLLKVNK